ncbi:hypothetical protein [Brevibacterium sp. ZH18]|uniref:hypothetical protein n=1 Tax=Brevibacterium sp. ZH18 TaxID=2927784 RepID=UPI001F60F36A|nr:hypothetical protein [Brevibacterium sp. ZH18]MCI4011255.1 hypothetical protein [Brevibacterium sp. ZH18]
MRTAGVVARKDDKVRSDDRWCSPILVVLLVSVLTLFTGADLNATSTRLTDVIASIADSRR